MLWTHAAAAIVAAVLAFSAGWKVRAWKAAGDELHRVNLEARDQIRRQDQVAQAGDRLEQSRERIRYVDRILTREVERVATRYVDRECLDADGVRIVNAAAAGLETAGGADGAMSAASAPQ